MVDCRSVGSGRAALKYLAPYIFRVALSNNRIVRVEDDQVTFRYRMGETGERRSVRWRRWRFCIAFCSMSCPKGL